MHYLALRSSLGVQADVRVLILGLNYAPELIGVGKYTAELAGWLRQRGHDVRVIAAPPYYPEWRLRPDQAGWRWRRETVQGIEVLRCPLWVPAWPSPGKRILHLLSFALSSFVPTLWQAFPGGRTWSGRSSRPRSRRRARCSRRGCAAHAPACTCRTSRSRRPARCA